MLSFGLVLLFIGIIFGTLGRIIKSNSVEKLGTKAGFVGIVLSIIGIIMH